MRVTLRRGGLMLVLLVGGAYLASSPGVVKGATAARCADLVRVASVSGGVVVRRSSRPVDPRRPLVAGDVIQMQPQASLELFVADHRVLLTGAQARLTFIRIPSVAQSVVLDAIGPSLVSGRVRLQMATGTSSRCAVAETPDAVAGAAPGGGVVDMQRAAGPAITTIQVDKVPALIRRPRARRGQVVVVQPTQAASVSDAGIRLDTWPFPLSDEQFQPASGVLPAYWADSRPCSVGCRAPGAVDGWPLRPFHQQHALRAGLNELRPANLHVGVDIEARDYQPVYAVAPGVAHIIASSGPDERVQVGQLIYWHIQHEVYEGQPITPYTTVLGRVLFGFRHLHLSEQVHGRYLNVLRPRGRVLAPYSDTAAPVIGQPQVYRDGQAVVDAFDPQSFIERQSYATPVLAPAALAWRLYSADGRPVSKLEFAVRSSQHVLPDSLRSVVFAPGARNPGFECFFRRQLCVPTWRYRLAGGLTPPLPLKGLSAGRYRVAVYAWDYADNQSERDTWVSVAPTPTPPVLPTAPSGRPHAAPDVQ